MDIFEDLNWLVGDPRSLLITALSACFIFVVIIILTRLNGLRTFAKMSSFDFAITIAMGSIIASTMMSNSPSLLRGAVGLTTLVILQAIVSIAKRKNQAVENAISNNPVLLMRGEKIIEENMRKSKISESDLYAKLREANVTEMSQVLAVVLETTGDISVLHSADKDGLDERLLKNVEE